MVILIAILTKVFFSFEAFDTFSFVAEKKEGIVFQHIPSFFNDSRSLLHKKQEDFRIRKARNKTSEFKRRTNEGKYGKCVFQ